MDSRASHDFLFSSDEEEEEEIFAGFTVKEIEQLREQQRPKEVLSPGEENNSSSENGDLEVEEIDNASDVDVFVEEEEGKEYNSNQSSEEEEATDAVHWSSTLSEINVEPFSIPHGPTKDLGPNIKSKDFFNLFIDDNFLDEIAANSIAYAHSKGDEISAFFGLNILIGIHSLPQVSMLWESDEFVASEGFKKMMPKHHFFTVSKYIHLSNPNSEDASDLLCKVWPLVTLLERKFAEAFVPGKNISVNEGLVKFNGRLSFKQYMPMKPNKFSIKVWLLADSDCYYIPQCQVYLGKNRTNSELFNRKGLGYYVVWTLGELYLDANCHFFFDNFFTSVDLLKSLHERNSYTCGTVRLHRHDLPADLKRMKLVSSEIQTHQSGNLVVTLWRDKRVVSMLSTNVLPETEIHAVQQTNMRGRMKRVVPDDAKKKPEVVSVYNSGMNSIDVNDQYRSYYTPGTTSKKWWKYLFWFFIDLAIVNAFILEKLAGRGRQQLPFRRELARLLIAGFNGYKRPSSSGQRAVSTFTTEQNIGGHRLGKMQGRKRACKMCAKAGRKRNDGRTFETSHGC